MAAGTPEYIAKAKSFAKQHHKLFINGAWVEAATSATIETFDPSTGDHLGAFPDASAADVNAAVTAARTCFENDWSRRDAKARSKVLRAMIDIIEANRDMIGTIEAMDIGMKVSLMPMMIDGWIDALEYFSGSAARITGQTYDSPGNWNFGNIDSSFYTLKEPVGVVGLILPWNAPGAFLINKIAPALAAGCTVVVKPPEQASLITLYLAKLFEEAGLPPGAFNVVTGGGQTAGQAIAKHPGIDKISFTGSTGVGKSIMRDGANNLKRLTLELGGKSAFVVMKDADVERAVMFLVMMGIYSAGQFCMCPSKVFVDKPLVESFTQKLQAALSAVKAGSAMDPDTDMGPLITLKQRARVTMLVNGAREEGAEVLLGGAEMETGGYHYQPTLLFNDNTNLAISHEEIFGPVLMVVPFDGTDLDAVTAMANETKYGLAASIWTKDLRVANTMVKRFKAGIIGVNAHGFIDPRAPFGGIKDSGLGREFGDEGLDAFLETKTVAAFY